MKMTNSWKASLVLSTFFLWSPLLAPPTAFGAGQSDPTFAAEGLHYEDVLTNFFTGNFVDIPFDRDEPVFSILFGSYVRTYASHCTAYLPEDKVELTRQECAREQVTTNGYGVEVSRTCIEWRTVPTGLYASPEMHHAMAVLDGLQAGDALRTMFRMLTDENPIGSSLSLVADAQAADADMVSLFKLNGCDGAGLMRFQENLRRFALNKQPIRLGGDPAGATDVDLSPENQDVPKLVEDLVFAHSKTWVMNRYQRGSVSEVRVSSHDDQGRAEEVTARYIYQGFSGRSSGSVRVTFADGLPECLYFHDFPYTCRTADRRIAADFVGGGYQKK